MSRRRRSTRKYTEKKSIEGTSQLEIDREETPVFIKKEKEKKHKPSRRGSRGRGLNKKEKQVTESVKKESPAIKNVEFVLSKDANDESIPHFADRVVFIVAARMDSDKRFIDTVGKPTTTYREAVNNCPPKHSVYTSEGIKVYPTPPHRLGNGKYSIRSLRTNEIEAMKYSELSEAIKNCRMGCGVFDPQNDRVY